LTHSTKRGLVATADAAPTWDGPLEKPAAGAIHNL